VGYLDKLKATRAYEQYELRRRKAEKDSLYMHTHVRNEEFKDPRVRLGSLSSTNSPVSPMSETKSPPPTLSSEADFLAACKRAFGAEEVGRLPRAEGDQRWQARLQEQRTRSWWGHGWYWPEAIAGLGPRTAGPFTSCQDCLEAPDRRRRIRVIRTMDEQGERTERRVPVQPQTGTFAFYGDRALCLRHAHQRCGGRPEGVEGTSVWVLRPARGPREEKR
jgi:hypothetical protein